MMVGTAQTRLCPSYETESSRGGLRLRL